jgi:hypothetical protein
MNSVSKSDFRQQLDLVRSGATLSSTIPSPAATISVMKDSVKGKTATSSRAASTNHSPAPSFTVNTIGAGANPNYRCPSVAEYRGTTASANRPKAKNEATASEQLSLPMMSIPEGLRNTHRTRNEITGYAADALLVGHGHIYTKANCSTKKGWKPGSF